MEELNRPIQSMQPHDRAAKSIAAIFVVICSLLLGVLFFGKFPQTEMEPIVIDKQAEVTEMKDAHSDQEMIEQIDQMVLEVDRMRSKDEFKVLKGEFPDEREYAVWYDDQNTIRLYAREQGSDHGYLWQAFYYDAKGKLRYVHMQGAATNKTEFVHIIYFDLARRRIEETQDISGPGWPLPEVWPDSEIVYEPVLPKGANVRGVSEAAKIAVDAVAKKTGISSSCVSAFLQEDGSTAEYFVFEVRELHNESCGGDPNIANRLATVRVARDPDVSEPVIFERDAGE